MKDIPFLAGLVILSVGVGMIFMPAGIIVAGFALAALGYLTGGDR